MRLIRRSIAVSLLLLGLAMLTPAQVIEFESNNLKYYALTRNGLTIMIAQLPSHVRDYHVMQVAVSNGGTTPQIVRPEDFLFLRDDGTEIPATPPRTVVSSMLERASRSDVVKLITSYESGLYGNSQYTGTNGYEQRRQTALTDFTNTRIRAAAAASAIVFVQTKLMPGQSTDGAIFYPLGGAKAALSGTVRVRTAGSVYEFPLNSALKPSE